MSVWTTKSSGRAREYVIIKHKVRGVNGNIGGVKFRNSYGVVEKDSKTYLALKRMPVIQKEDFPLDLLKKLPFITRLQDIQTVYGTDVYTTFLEINSKKVQEEKIEQKIQEEIKHIETNHCQHRTVRSGAEDLCKNDALMQSPSGYCLSHILQEPKLMELGIEVPKFIPKKEKKEYREKVAEQLKQLKSEGKF